MTTLARVEQTLVYSEPLDHPDPAFLMVLLFPTSDPPPTITIAEAWSTNLGYFVLLPATPPDQPTLSTIASKLQSDPAFGKPAHTSFAWTTWDGVAFAPPIFLPIAASDDGAFVSGTFPFGVGAYGIEMQDRAPIATTDADASAFSISYAPPASFPPGCPPPEFPPVWGPGINIPTSGPSRFCLIAQGLLGDLSNTPQTGLNVSLQYFKPNPKGGVDALAYPIFSAQPQNFFLIAQLTLDPLTTWWMPNGPLPNRTRYSFDGTGMTLTPGKGCEPWTLASAEATPLASNFRTLDGEAILLTTQNASFVPQPLPTQPGGFYLVPDGTFTLQTANAASSPSLLCGLSGTESISIADGSVIGFTSGQPAYAPGFPIVGGSGNTSGPLLTDTIAGVTTPAVTAWMSVSGSTDSIYTTQPQSSALFVAGDAPNVLPLLTPPVATLDAANVFPMVPYAGCDSSSAADTFLGFEQQILASARRAAMPAGVPDLALLGAPFGSGPVTATTPQGLLVTIEGSTWSSLILGSAVDTDGNLVSLNIGVVPPELQQALSSTDVFLVITNDSISVDNTLSVAGWPFSIALRGSPTILIFKFCAGSLEDMVAAPPLSAWTSANIFNGDPDAVQTTLEGILAAAKAQFAAGNSAFDLFVSTVSDPNWNGIVVLSSPLSLAGLPPDLVGLAAGIDAAQFQWHHLGINVTPVSPTLEPQASSIFGLIDYSSVDTPTNALARTNARKQAALRRKALGGDNGSGGDPGFSFRVLTLLAEFQNSQIIVFQSTIVLTVTTLFGETVQLPAGAQPVLKNSIVLEGHLETRVADDGTTVTVYVFSGTGILFFLTPASAILYYVAVTQSEFSTLQPPTDTDPTVLSEFRLWGTLDFQVMPGLDIFSFGDTTAPSNPTIPAGLAYSGLAIDMTFQITDPQNSVTFALDPSAVAFDPSSSVARPNSLFAGLPLSVDSLSSSASGGSTTTWLPVNARALNTSPIDSGNWFAIANVIDLGTMGALASLASFNALLVVLWTPGGPKPSAGLMMQLPGTSPGKSVLSLQDVLSLAIGQIVIPAGQPLQLLFNNISLSVFGLKLPSGAPLDLALGGGAAGESLGWYASYVAPSSDGDDR